MAENKKRVSRASERTGKVVRLNKDQMGDRKREQKRDQKRDQKREQKSVQKAAKPVNTEVKEKKVPSPCKYSKKCGGCAYLRETYEKQLKIKQDYVRKLMPEGIKVHPVTGMEDPWHYRNKVNAAFQRKRTGKIVSGIYEEGTHNVIPVEECLIEDKKADAIIGTIRKLIPSFRITVYNEDSGYGLLRHVMVRTGHITGQVLVILVVTDPVFPSKNNFVKALRKEHPEITSIVLNINDKQTSMVLGERNITLYGKGFIEDKLMGYTFRISPSSFYQINSVQTEALYQKAIDLAALTGKETVFDAYSGIGTIGISASSGAGEVICVELNKDAVRDAANNAKNNNVKNIRFYADDAGRFLTSMAEQGQKADVIFMDPPRSGSTEAFIKAACDMGPDRIVYISCEPETMARDLKVFAKRKYKTTEVFPFDMFPWTRSVETVAVLTKTK